ncbi:MAG: DUF5317 domain-containing protein, partial [Limnochordaceae bacterium]|nr:DUF5317 domain-containing protein [Limnochordaceae bacterium]
MGVIGLAGAAVGLVIGLARGGLAQRLVGLQVRGLALLVAGAGMEVAAHLAVGHGWAVVRWTPLLNAGAFGLYVVTAAVNLSLPGVPWLAVGAGLNLGVLVANGGKMPIVPWPWIHLRPELLAMLRKGLDPLHSLAGPGTRLAWFADYLVIPGIPSPIFSPGDLLIAIGAFLLLERGVRGVGLPG